MIGFDTVRKSLPVEQVSRPTFRGRTERIRSARDRDPMRGGRDERGRGELVRDSDHEAAEIAHPVEAGQRALEIGRRHVHRHHDGVDSPRPEERVEDLRRSGLGDRISHDAENGGHRDAAFGAGIQRLVRDP